MDTKKNFSEILKEVEPLKVNSVGEMSGGFLPMGGQNVQPVVSTTIILNEVLVGVLGYACACTCECTC